MRSFVITCEQLLSSITADSFVCRRNIRKNYNKIESSSTFLHISRRFPGNAFSGLCRNCHNFVSIFSNFMKFFQNCLFLHKIERKKLLLFNAKPSLCLSPHSISIPHHRAAIFEPTRKAGRSFPAFTKTGFWDGNKGRAIDSLRTDDDFFFIDSYSNVSAAFSLPKKVNLYLFQ